MRYSAFSDQSYCGSHLFVWGIRMCMLLMLLYIVPLFSPFVSGTVRVGIQDQLTVAGFDLICGNDLAKEQ